MDIRRFVAEDAQTVTAAVELSNAAAKVDAPFAHPATPQTYTGWMRHAWDGETPENYAAWDDGSLVGSLAVSVSERDNTHLGWIDLVVHPDHRCRGIGTQLLEFAKARTLRLGRRSLGGSGWESDATRGFAAKHAFPPKSSDINRRQYLAAVDWQVVAEMSGEAALAGSSYELVRIFGRTPDHMLDAVAAMTAAINDAPTDDLDIEDEVFSRERIIDYETAQLARRYRLYRVVAQHKVSGELAGHSVVAVEADRPEIGDQHDTAVLGAHRGHRLGMLVKTDMLGWLAEEEPQLKTIDTWNAESNDHMIEVNEKLGYVVLGRELTFQRDL